MDLRENLGSTQDLWEVEGNLGGTWRFLGGFKGETQGSGGIPGRHTEIWEGIGGPYPT